MRLVYGVGEAKLRDFGQAFFEVIEQHCRARSLSRDQSPLPPVESRPQIARAPRPQSAGAAQAAVLFRGGASIEEVARQLERSRGTVCEYLAEYIRHNKPESISQWVSESIYQQVAAAAERVGTERLKPIFVELNEQVPYDQIRVVLAHLANRS
jgi:ATP-dependent DNA helicase RecQ